MVKHWLTQQVAGLWPLVWHFGLGGVIIGVCVALYAFQPAFLSKFFPNIQRILIWVASVTLAIMVSTAIGVNLGEKRVHAQWDAARSAAVENAKTARANAVRDVARRPSRGVQDNGDRYNRDRH